MLSKPQESRFSSLKFTAGMTVLLHAMQQNTGSTYIFLVKKVNLTKI